VNGSTSIKALGQRTTPIDAYTGDLIVKAALRMASYVFVRPSELQRAEWIEFDIEAAQWKIPAERMKARQVHIVPLARQVVNILQDLQQYSRNIEPAERVLWT